MEQTFVNNMPLPQLLMELLIAGEWQTPDYTLLRKIAPFLKEEMQFLESIESMESNSIIDFSDYEHMFNMDSRKDPKADNLPWLDSSKAVLIAVNKYPGDDIAIALDYRMSIVNPRVVGVNWHDTSPPFGGKWEMISESFSEFAKALNFIRKR